MARLRSARTSTWASATPSRCVVTNPRIWGVSIAFFCLDIIRYGFFYWAPVFLIEVQGATISSAGLTVAVLPIAGSGGSIVCGWATGRFFDNRRAPVVCLCLFGLAIFSYLFYYAPPGAWLLSLFYLALIGFCTYGAHVLMVGHAAQDFAGRKAAASAAGFIDGFGYIGAAMTGIFTGWLVDNYSWTAGFWYWIIAALVAGFIMLALWRVPVVERRVSVRAERLILSGANGGLPSLSLVLGVREGAPLFTRSKGEAVNTEGMAFPS